jgi:uncharacterized protein (DUF433 family)
MEEEALVAAGVIPKRPKKQAVALFSTENVMGGDVCIQRTRVAAATLLRLMDAGMSNKDILHSFMSVNRDQVEVLRKLHEDYVLQNNNQTRTSLDIGPAPGDL